MIEETSVNLAYMWFVGINPEEKLPGASLLAKFGHNDLKILVSMTFVSLLMRKIS